ncbi:MAG: T9SS type A sorting domain-containing protein [Bacteroidales bacterium]|nr:T9SS type A sorting domain-containing protein [Bacteroidales bacterium]
MKSHFLFIAFLSLSISLLAQYPPPAGMVGTTAIHTDSNIFVSWANQCTFIAGAVDIKNPSLGLATYGFPESATGKAEGNANEVLSLGDGGSATLCFPNGIRNGEGFDFAVFENSFNDDFLELALVEVSSDGQNFYRFPSVSLTQTESQVATFGTLDATKIHNLAGKYRMGFGTPFDLEDLKNTAGLDINRITHVRIIDVVGCIDTEYATRDALQNIINDPYPTAFNTGGFDLDGIGVIHQASTGIISKEMSFVLKVYQLNNVLHIAFDSNKTKMIQLISLNGIVIVSGTSDDNRCEVPLNSLSHGLYILNMIQGTQVVSKKIIL